MTAPGPRQSDAETLHPRKLDVTGVVLAGGRSRRFGADKARYPLDGRRMIDRVSDVVSSVCPEVLVSVGADTPDYALEGIQAVPDRVRDGGPLAGLHAALLVADTPWLLVVACDMPFVTGQALRVLLDARSPQIDAVVSKDQHGRLHPLLGCYRRELLPALSNFLGSGRRSARAFVAETRTATVALDADGPLRNINSRNDLRSSGAVP